MSAGLFYVKMWHFFLIWSVGMRSFCFSLLFFSAMLAAETPRVDVEQTMKNMGFYYKQAIDAQAAEELQPALQQLIELAKQAQAAAYPADKAEQFQHGLTLVLAELEAAQLALTQQDMVTAKAHLQKVDALKKQYHKLRKVSIWQLLFGS